MNSHLRIALANLRFPGSPAESVELARNAVLEASEAGAGIICFPECFIPGYRGVGRALPPPTVGFLDSAWSAVAAAAHPAPACVPAHRAHSPTPTAGSPACPGPSVIPMEMSSGSGGGRTTVRAVTSRTSIR